MIEIRIHGRGGQGAVTTGQILAIATFKDGKYSMTFPMFGVERAGAPVQAFVRIDDKPINLRTEVYNPDVILVFEASLIKTVDVTKGLKENGLIIINTDKKPEELDIKGNYQIHTINATNIAMEIFNKPIVNTAVLGAFAKIHKSVSLESLKEAIRDKFESKGEKIIELNNKAIEKVYELTK